MFNAYTMIEDMRSQLSEPVAKHWTTKSLLAALNRSLLSVYRLISTSPGDWYLERSAATALVNSELPFFGIAAYGIKPAFLELVSDGTPIPIILNPRDKHLTYQDATGLTNSADLYAFIYRDAIRVNRANFTEQVYLWYERAVAFMHAGIATAGNVRSLTLAADADASMQDDYYNNEVFEAVTGAGAPLRFLVQDYAAATRVLTTDVGTFGAGTTYGTVPNIPEQALDLLVNQAMLYAYMKPGVILSKEFVALLQDETKRARAELQGWLATRIKESKRVRYTGAYNG